MTNKPELQRLYANLIYRAEFLVMYYLQLAYL